MLSPVAAFKRLPLLRQSQRRIAVVAAFTGYPLLQLGYVSLVTTGLLSTVVWAPIAIFLFALTLAGVAVIYGYSQDRQDRRLDEREERMVERSLVASYGVLTVVVALTIIAAGLYASFIGPFTVDMAVLTPIIVAFALYGPLLPFAAYAWIETDAPVDDEA